MTLKLKALLLTLAVGYPLDQLSKAWVTANIPPASPDDWIEVIPRIFYITHARNPGAAFGLMADWSLPVRAVVFSLAALMAAYVTVTFYRALAPRDRMNAIALGAIAAGALGNLTDRVMHGEVVDFLSVHLWAGFRWPDFNFADAFIVMGVATLILELLATEGEQRAADASATKPDEEASSDAARHSSLDGDG